MPFGLGSGFAASVGSTTAAAAASTVLIFISANDAASPDCREQTKQPVFLSKIIFH